MAAWREEDHPRDERGRWIPKGMQAAIQRRRTVERADSADLEDLITVTFRIAGKDPGRLTAKDRRDLAVLDAELARREAGGEQRPTPEQRKVDELIAAGASFEDAYREAYGEQDQGDDSDRRKGETREQMRRRQFSELTALAVLEAEAATNGYLVSKAGRNRRPPIDPASLFTGPRARADKWASEELKRWWADHPRRTYAEYRAEVMGDSGSARSARSRRRQATNGKDFG